MLPLFFSWLVHRHAEYLHFFFLPNLSLHTGAAHVQPTLLDKVVAPSARFCSHAYYLNLLAPPWYPMFNYTIGHFLYRIELSYAPSYAPLPSYLWSAMWYRSIVMSSVLTKEVTRHDDCRKKDQVVDNYFTSITIWQHLWLIGTWPT